VLSENVCVVYLKEEAKTGDWPCLRWFLFFFLFFYFTDSLFFNNCTCFLSLFIYSLICSHQSCSWMQLAMFPFLLRYNYVFSSMLPWKTVITCAFLTFVLLLASKSVSSTNLPTLSETCFSPSILSLRGRTRPFLFSFFFFWKTYPLTIEFFLFLSSFVSLQYLWLDIQNHQIQTCFDCTLMADHWKAIWHPPVHNEISACCKSSNEKLMYISIWSWSFVFNLHDANIWLAHVRTKKSTCMAWTWRI